MEVIFDEYNMRKLPPRERLDKITQILRNEKHLGMGHPYPILLDNTCR
jgi:hypothetical protein